MTETDYQNECIRAELFDLPIPSREEFFSRQRESTVEENAEEDEEQEKEEKITTIEQEEDAGVRQEGFHRIAGGLDELNSILSSTQKKLNRFKTIYGSLSNLLKVKTGSKNEETANQVNLDSGSGNLQDSEENKPESASACSVIKKGGDSQLDKLDSLIYKAERAEMSFSKQNKQMRKFLN